MKNIILMLGLCTAGVAVIGCTTADRGEYKAVATPDSASLFGSAVDARGIGVWIVEIDGVRIRQDRRQGPTAAVPVAPGHHQVMIYVASDDQRAHHVVPIVLEPNRPYQFTAEPSGLDFVLRTWLIDPVTGDKTALHHATVRGEPVFRAAHTNIKQ